MLTYLPRRTVRRGLSAVLSPRGLWAVRLAALAFLIWTGVQ